VGLFPAAKAGAIVGTGSKSLLKSRQGSLHESVRIRPRLGGGEAFLSTATCMHKKFCLDERKSGSNTSRDSSLEISDCIDNWCLWKKLGALPTLQETEFPCSE